LVFADPPPPLIDPRFLGSIIVTNATRRDNAILLLEHDLCVSEVIVLLFFSAFLCLGFKDFLISGARTWTFFVHADLSPDLVDELIQTLKVERLRSVVRRDHYKKRLSSASEENNAL
jgi:predicted ATP-grasp superfamily ATP-dependent carboligase